ncbi:MAG: NAD(P)-dependent oxidoreductase [Desulfobacteraceae bacterium]|nr:NAD(P)-dependent oxidoreductase [Desulfobacteraceae bacterium]
MIAVTGAAGQLGRMTIQVLLQQGVSIHAYDRVPARDLGCPYTVVDLVNPPIKFYWPHKVKSVLHLAGLRDQVGFSIDGVRTMLEANLQCMATALAACGAQVRRFAYVSSMSVYAAEAPLPTPENGPINPVSIYAISKWLGELACHAFQAAHPACQMIIVRLAQIYGPRSPENLAIYKLINQALDTGHMYLDCIPDLKRDFLYLDDAAKALALALQTCPSGTFNIGSGKSTSMQELADAVAVSVENPTTIEFGMNHGIDRILATDAFREATGFVPSISLRNGIAQEVERIVKERGIQRGRL